jgi:SAM-dependent methyltransferase
VNDYASVADLYDAYVSDTRDHAFWGRCAAQATGRILELTAGTGRATAALQRASRQPVVALDLAHAMLRRLVGSFHGAQQAALAVCGDATGLPFPPAQFGLVVIPFNSFGELIEPDERAAALRETRRVLAPGGRAVVTLHDPGRRRETLDNAVRTLGPFAAGDRRLEVLVRGRMVNGDQAESEQTYRVLDRGGQVLEERRLTLRFVLPDAASFLRMAGDTGLAARSLFGDYDESPYLAGESPFIVAVLEPYERRATKRFAVSSSTYPISALLLAIP